MSESGATEREPDPTSERLAHQQAGSTEPDVLLDIPEVSVDSIRLAVDGLDADLSLRARLANLLQLDAGVRVHLKGVELDITGVHAEALLKVRLEKLLTILDRALTTIDRNPQVIEALARTVETSVDDVNRSAQQLAGEAGPLLGQAGEQAGQAVREAGQVGQQVGAVGAVADRSLREQAGAQTPDRRCRRRAPGRPSRRPDRVGRRRRQPPGDRPAPLPVPAGGRPGRRPRATVGPGPGRPAARKARPRAGGAAPGRRGRPGRPRWPARPGRPCGRPAGASGRRSRAAWARAASTARSDSPAPGRVAVPPAGVPQLVEGQTPTVLHPGGTTTRRAVGREASGCGMPHRGEASNRGRAGRPAARRSPRR